MASTCGSKAAFGIFAICLRLTVVPNGRLHCPCCTASADVRVNITPYRGSNVSYRIAESPGNAISQRVRKRIEEIFGSSRPYRDEKAPPHRSSAQSLLVEDD